MTCQERAYNKQNAIAILSPGTLGTCAEQSIPVMLIGTTSAWTVWACCRIFSSGVGKGSDLVQLVWVLRSEKSLEVGVLGLLVDISLSSSNEEIEHCRGKRWEEAIVCKCWQKRLKIHLKKNWSHLGTETMVCQRTAHHPEMTHDIYDSQRP